MKNKMLNETENPTLMAVLLAGISGCILTWTGGYVMYAKSNSNPLIVYSCMAVSVLLFAISCLIFKSTEKNGGVENNERKQT